MREGYSVLALIEKCLTQNIEDNEFFDNRYTVHRCDRSLVNSDEASGDGVLLRVNRRFNSACLPVGDSSVEELWVRISVGRRCFIVGCVYIPSNSNTVKYSSHVSTSEDICNTYSCDIIVLGDFSLSSIV